MRIIVIACLASGCAASVPTSRGVTRARYQGGTPVFLTNATPATLCELRMSPDDTADYGDNWLPSGGLASGASIELHVAPGTYKAMWRTCAASRDQPYFAATRWRDLAIEVKRETQLYAYVADKVAPTKRAPVRDRDCLVVHFQGQPVESVASMAHRPVPPPAQVDRFAAAERELAASTGERAPAADAQRFEPFDASAYVDPKLDKRRVARGR